MNVGKNKHHLTKILRRYHREADTDNNEPAVKVLRIHPYPPLNFSYNSSHVFDMTGITTVKGPKTMYAKPSSFKPTSILALTGFNVGGFTDNNFKLGENGHFNLNKTRIITKIKILCTSNVNSQVLKPTIQLNTSNTDPPTNSSYAVKTDAYRTNPGGYVGFNLVKITKDKWENRNYEQMSLLDNLESLFKNGTYYHSEIPYEANNLSWVLKKGEDLILTPNFDYFHSRNCSYVLDSGKQAISVLQPYYQFVVELNYFDI